MPDGGLQCTFGSGRDVGLPCMPQRLDRVSQEEIYTALINKETDYFRSKEEVDFKGHRTGREHGGIHQFPVEKSNTGRFEFVRHPSYVRVVWKPAPPATPATPALQASASAPGLATVAEREAVVQLAPTAPEVVPSEQAPSVRAPSEAGSSRYGPPGRPGATPPVGMRPGAYTPPGARAEPPLPGRMERKLGKSGRIDRLVIDRDEPTGGTVPVLEKALDQSPGKSSRAERQAGVPHPPPPGQYTDRDKLQGYASAPQLPHIPKGQLGLLGAALDPRYPPTDHSPPPTPAKKVDPGPKKFRGVGIPKRKNAGEIAVPKHLVDQVDMQQLDRHWPEFKPDMSKKLSRKHPPVYHTMMMPGTR